MLCLVNLYIASYKFMHKSIWFKYNFCGQTRLEDIHASKQLQIENETHWMKNNSWPRRKHINFNPGKLITLQWIQTNALKVPVFVQHKEDGFKDDEIQGYISTFLKCCTGNNWTGRLFTYYWLVCWIFSLLTKQFIAPQNQILSYTHLAP